MISKRKTTQTIKHKEQVLYVNKHKEQYNRNQRREKQKAAKQQKTTATARQGCGH
jgi:hypothetical protein